jgi:predicted transcriptional regulator of viral defense system
MARVARETSINEITAKFVELDRAGIKVFSRSDLSIIFGVGAPWRLQGLLSRFLDSGTLERVARGVYLNSKSRSSRTYLIEEIACVLRRAYFNYVSLESILSEFGVISQAMTDRITIMTSGPRGIFVTPYGTIEFTHTSRSLKDLRTRTVSIRGRPLLLARKSAGISDLRRVGRNINMLDPEEI